MAEIEYVDQFLASETPLIAVEVDTTTKEALASLMDSYTSAGYTAKDLAAVIEERVPASLADTSVEELKTAVTELSDAVRGEVAQTEVAQTGGETGTDTSAAEREPTAEEILAHLSAAAGQDATELINGSDQQLIAQVVGELWKEVRTTLAAEIAADPETWGTGPQAKEAAWEVAFEALIKAVDGFCAEGEADGGFATLLSRQQS